MKVSLYKWFVLYILLTFFLFVLPFRNTTVDMLTYMFLKRHRDSEIWINFLSYALVAWNTLLFTFCLHIYFQSNFFVISSFFPFIYLVPFHISIPSYGNTSLHMPSLYPYYPSSINIHCNFFRFSLDNVFTENAFVRVLFLYIPYIQEHFFGHLPPKMS